MKPKIERVINIFMRTVLNKWYFLVVNSIKVITEYTIFVRQKNICMKKLNSKDKLK